MNSKKKVFLFVVGISLVLTCLWLWPFSQHTTTAAGMSMFGDPVNVGPVGSLPHWLMYHSEDSDMGMLPPSTSPLKEWVPDLANNANLIATSGNWSEIW
ncbi:MAG TPA: hypothetical protein VE973_03125, partial [Candidatus Limnocylindria bacterium]|nr:hypothetical protein [Candidatus Limnocylindria bacterium]